MWSSFHGNLIVIYVNRELYFLIKLNWLQNMKYILYVEIFQGSRNF